MTVAVTTNKIPDRSPEQDEALVLFAMRRTDQPNPTGSPDPDLGNTLSTSVQGEALRDLCVALGFDPEQSYVSVVGVTDVEADGGGAITIGDLLRLQGTSTSEPTEADAGVPAPSSTPDPANDPGPEPTDDGQPTDPEVAAEG